MSCTNCLAGKFANSIMGRRSQLAWYCAIPLGKALHNTTKPCAIPLKWLGSVQGHDLIVHPTCSTQSSTQITIARTSKIKARQNLAGPTMRSYPQKEHPIALFYNSITTAGLSNLG